MLTRERFAAGTTGLFPTSRFQENLLFYKSAGFVRKCPGCIYDIDEQVLFKGNYQRRINSPIITTANELVKEEISEFSKKLSIEELYNYIIDVDTSTTQVLKALTYSDIKEKITDEKRKQLEMLNVVSDDENAYWLIDYWCGKDVKGLIQMPFSRHWIMHIEACLRIRDKQLSIK